MLRFTCPQSLRCEFEDQLAGARGQNAKSQQQQCHQSVAARSKGLTKLLETAENCHKQLPRPAVNC